MGYGLGKWNQIHSKKFERSASDYSILVFEAVVLASHLTMLSVSGPSNGTYSVKPALHTNHDFRFRVIQLNVKHACKTKTKALHQRSMIHAANHFIRSSLEPRVTTTPGSESVSSAV